MTKRKDMSPDQLARLLRKLDAVNPTAAAEIRAKIRHAVAELDARGVPQ